ncbi:hypothetical protein KXD40_005239 [Peronospora effusa]|nr:hypothetical protein KXD40_005239 [Peronospora effusa]
MAQADKVVLRVRAGDAGGSGAWSEAESKATQWLNDEQGHGSVNLIIVEFVDLDTICGVAVNEAITFSNVVYSLVLMVEGQSDMVLPFKTFRPRVTVLQDIYHETKLLLFPNGSDRKMCLPNDVAPRPC